MADRARVVVAKIRGEAARLEPFCKMPVFHSGCLVSGKGIHDGILHSRAIHGLGAEPALHSADPAPGRCDVDRGHRRCRACSCLGSFVTRTCGPRRYRRSGGGLFAVERAWPGPLGGKKELLTWIAHPPRRSKFCAPQTWCRRHGRQLEIEPPKKNCPESGT